MTGLPVLKHLCLACVAIGFAAPAAAAPWSGEVTLGYLETSGNGDSRTSNAKAELIYESGTWRNSTAAAFVQATQDGQTSAERYSAGNKLDLKFTEIDYAFLSLEYEKDLVGTTRERYSETAGYGRKLLVGPTHHLDAEIGAGARQTEEQLTGTRESDAIARVRGDYRWDFSEVSHFRQVVKSESGESNTFTESVTELKLALIGQLFGTASYTLRYNTDVPAGTQKSDTITAVSLSWSFGKDEAQ